MMNYTLTFKHHGKSYINSESIPGKYMTSQYEAVACGLLLGEIDSKRLSRDDVYTDLCLREEGKENGIAVNRAVWTAQRYIPISQEVKL